MSKTSYSAADRPHLHPLLKDELLSSFTGKPAVKRQMQDQPGHTYLSTFYLPPAVHTFSRNTSQLFPLKATDIITTCLSLFINHITNMNFLRATTPHAGFEEAAPDAPRLTNTVETQTHS